MGAADVIATELQLTTRGASAVVSDLNRVAASARELNRNSDLKVGSIDYTKILGTQSVELERNAEGFRSLETAMLRMGGAGRGAAMMFRGLSEASRAAQGDMGKFAQMAGQTFLIGGLAAVAVGSFSLLRGELQKTAEWYEKLGYEHMNFLKILGTAVHLYEPAEDAEAISKMGHKEDEETRRQVNQRLHPTDEGFAEQLQRKYRSEHPMVDMGVNRQGELVDHGFRSHPMPSNELADALREHDAEKKTGDYHTKVMDEIDKARKEESKPDLGAEKVERLRDLASGDAFANRDPISMYYMHQAQQELDKLGKTEKEQVQAARGYYKTDTYLDNEKSQKEMRERAEKEKLSGKPDYAIDLENRLKAHGQWEGLGKDDHARWLRTEELAHQAEEQTKAVSERERDNLRSQRRDILEGPKFAGASEVGSAESMKDLNRWRFSRDTANNQNLIKGEDPAANVAQQQLTEQQKMAVALEKLASQPPAQVYGGRT